MYLYRNNLFQLMFSLVLDPLDDVDHLVDLYDSTLRDIVYDHALSGQVKFHDDQRLHGQIITYNRKRDTECIVR